VQRLVDPPPYALGEKVLAGTICARAEAHVVRLALLYALLDEA
jgi:hypothetical protein